MITHTNRIVLGGGIVVGIIILGGISYPVVRGTFTNTTPPVVQPETHFTSTVNITAPIAATSTEAILAAVTQAAASPDSLTEILLVNPSTGNALSATELFSLFAISVPATFQSSIVDVSLGVYREEPWISFMTTDVATAQGGMLDWENRMSDDLRPWYGDIVRDVKTTNITAFSDTTIERRDVRILKDASGAERITYGFVTPNYLLITSNSTAWLNLKQQWRTNN